MSDITSIGGFKRPYGDGAGDNDADKQSRKKTVHAITMMIDNANPNQSREESSDDMYRVIFLFLLCLCFAKHWLALLKFMKGSSRISAVSGMRTTNTAMRNEAFKSALTNLKLKSDFDLSSSHLHSLLHSVSKEQGWKAGIIRGILGTYVAGVCFFVEAYQRTLESTSALTGTTQEQEINAWLKQHNINWSEKLQLESIFAKVRMLYVWFFVFCGEC